MKLKRKEVDDDDDAVGATMADDVYLSATS